MAWTDERLDDLARHLDARFDGVDQRFQQVDQRFEQVDRLGVIAAILTSV